MRVLITGAFGFVGISIVRALAAKPDVTVVASDVYLPDPAQRAFLEPVHAHINTMYLNVVNRQAVYDAIRAEGITHILHAAALTPTATQEAENPGQIVDVNLGGTVNLLVAAAELKQIERVLTVSSSGVYGAPTQVPAGGRLQQEQDDLQLDNLYAITKRSSELLTRRFSQLSGTPMAAIRLGSIYGPMERVSKSRPFLSHPGQLAAALQAGQRVKVAGPDVTREWTYAADVGEAIDALFIAARWQYDVYNIGRDHGITFRQMVETFEQHGLVAEWVSDPAEADLKMVAHDERLPLAVDRLRADTGGFSPETEFAHGIAIMLQEDSRAVR